MIGKQNIFRRSNKTLSEEDIMMMSPLQLAYIGDGVFELFVRTHLASRDATVNRLHRQARLFVKAQGQARILDQLEEILTEEELRIVKRGRNTKTHSSPKHADIGDYRKATGFEALLGYLYLRGEEERLEEIFTAICHLNI